MFGACRAAAKLSSHTNPIVVRGLDPRIHVGFAWADGWIAGSRPGDDSNNNLRPRAIPLKPGATGMCAAQAKATAALSGSGSVMPHIFSRL